jgi:20S proteasome alpha/beta subunit
VTIAVGFFCNEGVLLCADSQQTITGYVKEYRGKIELMVMGDFAIAIAGSGTTDYIKTAADAITQSPLEFKNLKQFEIVLRERCLEFFNRHILPWSSFPEAERPNVELLIAVTGSTRPQYHALFHSCGTSFQRVHAKAIGSGVLLANGLISQYTPEIESTLHELSSLAIYVTSKVKNQVDGCGGHTDLVVLEKSGRVGFAQPREIAELENTYDALEDIAVRKLRSEIIGNKLKALVWLKK